MKKIISIILALTLLFSATVCVFAAECSHNYLRTIVEANCCEKAHMLYSCRRCGYSYKVYDDSYETPESFYILASSLREDNTLTVKVEIFNTPGLTYCRIPVKFNTNTLVLKELINGSLWPSHEIVEIDISTVAGSFAYFAAKKDIENGPNHKNGIFFTAVFDIIDEDGDYGIYFPISNGDFPTLGDDGITIIKNIPKFISIVGKSELGDHSYTESVISPTCTTEGYTQHICIFCENEYIDNYTDMTGHSWEFISETVSPTLDSTGEALHVCSACNEEKTVIIPALERYMKGDINNDGLINSLDSNLLKRFLVKASPTIQQRDASDINNDGQINSMDSFLLKRIISGKTF